jgi:hypothetical protein
MTQTALKMLPSNKSSASSNNPVTKLVLTKERIRQHLQTGEVHYQQYTKKRKHGQKTLFSNTESWNAVPMRICKKS